MADRKQSRYERAMAGAANVFDEPQAVLDDPHLTQDEKEKILRQWEQDARQLQVAEEEAMGGGEESMLHRVLEALDKLRRQ